jgi:hypothetical protein
MALTQIELGMLKDGILTADTAGRLKMADGFVNDAKISGVAASKVSGQLADANMAPGSVIQVVQGQFGFGYNGSTSTYTEMTTSARTSITPSSSSSKIFVTVSGGRLSYSSPTVQGRLEIRRSTNGGSTWVSAHRFVQDISIPNGAYGYSIAGMFLDEPATTSSCMYSLFASITTGTAGWEAGSSAEEKCKFTLMEIAG